MGKIVISTGGTGGHIFPALALSEVLQKKDYQVHILTDQKFQKYVKYYDKNQVHYLAITNIFAPGLKNKIISLIRLLISIVQSLIYLYKIKPRVVIGFGGYPSFPTLFAAIIMRIDIVIHEQNSVLGKTNRFFINFAKILAIGFNKVDFIESKYHNKVVVVGNPVRESFNESSKITYSVLKEDGKINILIIGGSQGASIFGKIIKETISKLSKYQQSKIRLVQQARDEQVKELQDFYVQIGLNAEVKNFFEDIEKRIANASFIISRAGASTLSELIIAKRPAILVPLLNSANDHQLYNARYFQEKKFGICVEQKDFTSDFLKEFIIKVFDNYKIIENLQHNFEENKDNSALKFAEQVEKLLSMKK